MDEAELQAAGLLEGVEGEGPRRERIALVQELLANGFELAELQEAAARGRLALLPVDRVLSHQAPHLTPREVAAQSGVPLELLRRLWRALGFTEAGDDEVAFTDSDLAAAKTVGQFHAAGLGDDELALISQVLGHTMSRLSDTLREIVGDALLEAGDSEHALALRYAQAADYMVPLLTPLLEYVLGVHLKEQIKQDVVVQEELATGRVLGAREITVCFADLVGFTSLGERLGAAELGSAGRRLTDIAVEAARPPVRLVKTIGDAAVLVAPEPEPLLEAALALVDSVEQQGEAMPRVRVGVASGEAIAQSGDWFGAPVNLASRVTDVARPMSVLATETVRRQLPDAYAWSFAGRRRFRGVRGDVRLYRVRPLSTL